MNHNAGDFEGIKRFDARRQIIDALKVEKLYVKSEDNPMALPVCQKSKDIIELRLKPRWWMKMRGMADATVKAVKDGEITTRPESTERTSSVGWRTFMTGIYHGNYGGDVKVLPNSSTLTDSFEMKATASGGSLEERRERQQPRRK